MLVTMTTSARQLQEGAVALVGFDHHPVAGAQPRVGAVGIDDAAIDHGRVEAAGVEQGRDHRRRRGLAVGAGDRNAALQPHQFGEHLGAADHGNALRARRHQFRIVALDRGRHHDHVGAVDILRLVADRNRDALLAQPRDIGAVGRIRALHGVTEIAQDLGDAAHADAADPDEVDGSDLARQSHAMFPVPCDAGELNRRHGLLDAPLSRGMTRGFSVKFRPSSPPDRPAARRHRGGRRCGHWRPSRRGAAARRRAPRFPRPAGPG